MHVPPFSLSDQISELGPELDAAVLKVLRSGQYIGGEVIQTFEKAFAKVLNVPFVIGCNSGTDALVLALRALDIGEGDEVITCSFSFFATSEAISIVGAKPIFVDVEPSTYLIDLEQIESVISTKTKAILPVHLFGRPVDMERLMDFARRHKLKVIEDCAQATGSSWAGRPVGSWGDVGCFSFFPTKNLGAAGDAGAVATNDGSIAKRIRELAVHGMPRRYVHAELGYNSRLDAMQAAVLNVKLPKLFDWIEKRKLIAKRYDDSLKDIPYFQLPSQALKSGIVHSWNQYVIRVSNFSQKGSSNKKDLSSLGVDQKSFSLNHSRDLFKEILQSKGINTIIYYPIPIHKQPAYSNSSQALTNLPITESLCKQVLSLPIFPELTLQQQDYVIDQIKYLV